MTTLEEFKEIEAKATKGPWEAQSNTCFWDIVAEDNYSIGDMCSSLCIDTNEADNWEKSEANAKIAAISRSALPALIAVAEGMAEALEGVVAHNPKGPHTPHWAFSASYALAAFEAWKENIESGEK